MKINKSYLHLFKKVRSEYLYKLVNGIYLAFDKNTLEYIGIEMYFLPKDIEYINKKADKVLDILIYDEIIDTSL